MLKSSALNLMTSSIEKNLIGTSIEKCDKCNGVGKYIPFFRQKKECERCNGFGIIYAHISFVNRTITEFKFSKKPRFIYNYGRKSWLTHFQNKVAITNQRDV